MGIAAQALGANNNEEGPPLNFTNNQANNSQNQVLEMLNSSF
jgi:hypothetical protein